MVRGQLDMIDPACFILAALRTILGRPNDDANMQLL